MRKASVLLALVLALMLGVAAAAPLARADDVTRPGDRLVVTWTPAALALTLAPGETMHARASFSSRVAISRAALVVSYPLSRYVQVEPRGPFEVAAGVSYVVDLTITFPDDQRTVAPALLKGSVQVVGAGQFLLAPLPVTITRAAPRPPIHWTPAEVRLAVDATADSAAVPSATTTVSFTTGVTITNAHFRPTEPLNRVLELSETGPVTLTPGITYTLTITAHEPAHLDAADTDSSASPSAARRVVSGVIDVVDGQRVYPRALPVTVVLAPVPVAPVITWKPPLVNVRMEAGQTKTLVVTMTSNITVENARLRVTGAITPSVGAAVDGSAPFTMLPRVPYAVTLTITSPVSPLFNRPMVGSVEVVDGRGRVLRQDLKVTLMWQRQPLSPVPTPTP